MPTSIKRDMSRTIAALAEYDAYNDAFHPHETQHEVLAQFAELERLARAVGRAYGLDTSDINSPDTCEGVIRPGHKIPGPGCELSFVRRMVREL